MNEFVLRNYKNHCRIKIPTGAQKIGVAVSLETGIRDVIGSSPG
jgi:hypothetical protein